jgi:hypothetical protein
LLAMTLTIWAAAAGGDSIANFKKLQALDGSWLGKDEQGNVVKTNFKVMVAGSMVMETLAMPEMEEMVTIYSLDGDSIALIHYCPTKNQPRMRARPTSSDATKLEFVFEGAGNLPDEGVGHEHKLVMEFQDANHLTERWTWRQKGKDTEFVYHFVRHD